MPLLNTTFVGPCGNITVIPTGERKVGQITISAQSGRAAPIGLLREFYRAFFLKARARKH